MNYNLDKLKNYLKEKIDKLILIENEKIFLSSFFEILNLLNLINNDCISEIKTKDRNLFLFFVASIKELSDNFFKYIESISHNIKSFYTESLLSEIQNVNLKINSLKQELFESNSLYQEKEHIEKEYKNYQLLIEQKNELLRKKQTIENINIKEIENECNTILNQIEEVNNKIIKIQENKDKYKEKLELNNSLENQLLEIKKEYETHNEFLFEKFLFLANIFQNNINDKKSFYFEQLEQLKSILKVKEEEFQMFVSKIQNDKDIYLNKINAISNHFSSNKDIIETIKALDDKINQKITRINNDLLEIDNYLSEYIKTQQNIINKIMNENL
jgi:hypothetical protein